jgi:predicted ester cyclase
MSNPKSLLERAVEAWNGKDEAAFVALGSDAMTITASGGIELRGLEGLRQYYSLWRVACPDNVIRYHSMVSEGSRVIGEATFTGTHTGVLHHPAGEIPPTGRRVSADFVGSFGTSNDKFTSLRIYFDVMDLMIQLGLVGNRRTPDRWLAVVPMRPQAEPFGGIQSRK